MTEDEKLVGELKDMDEYEDVIPPDTDDDSKPSITTTTIPISSSTISAVTASTTPTVVPKGVPPIASTKSKMMDDLDEDFENFDETPRSDLTGSQEE